MDHIPVRMNSEATEPTRAPAPLPRHSQGAPSAPAPKKPRRKRLSGRHFAALAASVFVILIFVIGAWGLYRTSVGAQIEESKYQAVFFENGQVYFGKLEKIGGEYFLLNDIFYLQTQSDATGEDSANPQETSAQGDSNVQLIKLGNEIHGPEDKMVFNQDQMLFFENLKTDSTVSKTIDEFRTRE